MSVPSKNLELYRRRSFSLINYPLIRYLVTLRLPVLCIYNFCISFNLITTYFLWDSIAVSLSVTNNTPKPLHYHKLLLQLQCQRHRQQHQVVNHDDQNVKIWIYFRMKKIIKTHKKRQETLFGFGFCFRSIEHINMKTFK